jgi:Flp pilus assembly protein protease CpaA
VALVSVPWWLPFAVALALGVVALVIELKTDEIPNPLTLGLLFVAGCLAIVDGHLGSHAGGLVVSTIVCSVLYRQDLLGGGTLKWTVALGTLLGLRASVVMIVVAGVLFGAAIGMSRLRKRLLFTVPSTPCLLVGVLAALVDVVAKQRAWW